MNRVMPKYYWDKDFSVEKRKKLEKSGAAMKGGRFPIESAQDVKNAVRDYNRIGQPANVKAHIIRRAKAVGAESSLPEGWGDAVEDGTIMDADVHDGSVQSIQLCDTFTVDAVRKTRDGFLVADARVARTGIQIYKGREVGRPNMDEVRVYRPPEEVFHTDAMHSMAHRPVTLRHPHEPVDASNWRKYSVGQTGDEIARDGDCVRVPMVVMDQAAVDAYEKEGIKELSMGYSADLEWTSGRTQDGEEYDAVQRTIRANHLAIVPVARGGSQLRIGDNTEGVNDMTTALSKVIMIDGVPVNTDDVGSAVIQRHITKLSGAAEDLQGKLDKEAADREEAEEEHERKMKDAKSQLETKDGEIAALKKKLEDAESKLKPEHLDAMVMDRATVVLSARSILGQKYTYDGKSNADIRKDVVKHKMGDESVKDMTDAAIEGAFKVVTKDAGKERTDGRSTRPLADALGRNDQSGGTKTPAELRDSAYESYTKSIGDAWRNKPNGEART